MDLNISDLVRKYIDAPVKGLLEREFEGENIVYPDGVICSGLTDLFKAADRRIEKNRLVDFSVMLNNYVAYKIIVRRLYPDEYVC